MDISHDNMCRIPLSRMVAGMACLFSCALCCAAQELAVDNPYKIQAAFIRNFAHYVNWPEKSFTGDKESWRVCIAGPDPFGQVLEQTLKGREEQGRAFSVIRSDDEDVLVQCHIVFIAYKDAARRRSAMERLKRKPILLVGDSPEFLREGGVIAFQTSDRVRMGVNLDQAKAASLVIQTRMLEVSSEVLENGSIHHLR
jgi:hypothetical protein